jgi:hypothetical protein
MRKFFRPLASVSRITIESQALKSNMLANPSVRWSVRLKACIFGGAPAGVFVPVAVSGPPRPC